MKNTTVSKKKKVSFLLSPSSAEYLYNCTGWWKVTSPRNGKAMSDMTLWL